jgi:deoxyribodipyrimidine photo-lyase
MATPSVPAATRSAGLARLSRFSVAAAGQYAASRNLDFGPERRGNTSLLSPYIRHRLVAEREVVEAVLGRHAFSAARKFIEEVFWRAYFKGWLEQHPSVWSDYRQTLAAQLQRLETDAGLLDRYDTATSGNTGIDCFDAWIDELVETGYLHNHARMWFASIWVFTLQLPWQLGADFFLRHLLDGDPASNTLGWRWVSGLHTRGKTYLARVSNIVNFTDNRFNPQGKLATIAKPLSEARVHPLRALPDIVAIPEDPGFGLLVTEDDCVPEIQLLERRPSAVLGVVATRRRSPLPVGMAAFDFARHAVLDALLRAEQAFEAQSTLVDDDGGRIVDWARSNELDTVVTPYVPIGPTREMLDSVRNRLERDSIRLLWLRRDFDSASWPHATHGFFRLKKAIPEILSKLGIATTTAGSRAS